MQQSNIFRSIGICAVFVAATVFAALVYPPYSTAELVDRVVAIVNDDIITLSELEEETGALYSSIAKKNDGESLLESRERARGATLDNMIIQKLIDQKAKKAKISVSEEEVEIAFTQMKEKAKDKGVDFQEQLASSGMDEKQYRNRLRSQLLQNKLLSFDVRAKVVISDEMLQEYYDNNYTTQVGEGTYYLLQMGFAWPSEDDQEKQDKEKEKARKLAERIRQLAIDGQDFKELAKKYSQLPSAAEGGDLGTFTLDDMADAMREVIAPLKEGEISAIIETPTNFQFFKLLVGKNDSGKVSTVPFDEVKEKIRNILYEEQLKSAYDSWIKELKDNAYIQKL